MTTVLLHFGDGTFHAIDVEADDPETAINEARTFVQDNAFFRVEEQDGECRVLAEESL